MQGKKLLVIDDDPLIRDLVSKIFKKRGAQVITAQDGNEGLQRLVEFEPDLVLLDVLMPSPDGWQTLQMIREVSDVAVIMLTVLVSSEDIIRALDAGANDYISKPFHPDILVARARKTLGQQKATRKYRVHDDDYLRIDLASRQIFVTGEPVNLTKTEFNLLALLVQNTGRLCTYEHILATVWGDHVGYSKQNVHLYVCQLRRKIEPDPRKPIYIHTSHGLGYFFDPRNHS